MKSLPPEDDPKLLKSLVHIWEPNPFCIYGVSNGEDPDFFRPLWGRSVYRQIHCQNPSRDHYHLQKRGLDRVARQFEITF